MKTYFSLILVLTAGAAYGQSNLPTCKGGDGSTWSYCFGTYTVTQAPYKGDVYVGEFGALGVFHGKGAYFHLNGDKYVGEYKDGKRNGLGTFTWSSGDKYVGEHKDGKSDGQGTYFHLNGEKYVGEYKDGKRNGLGTFTWSSGDIYVGEFKDGAKHGQGYMMLANGKVGLGEYANNSPNGRFISYKADGSIESSGIFKDGTLLTSQYIDPNSFTRIARNNSAPAVSDSQRQAIEQRERQVELEAQRLAEERRRLEEDKHQRELAKQSSRMSITATAG